MATRNSRIRRGAEYQKALNNYVQHLQTLGDRPRRVGQGKDRDEQVQVFIIPFGKDIEADEMVPWYTSKPQFTVLKDAINNASTNGAAVEAIGSKKPRTLPGFRPARVTWFRNEENQRTTKNSEVTDIPYNKYTGDRFSAPFGATSDEHDIHDVFAEIKRLLKAQTTYRINRVSLTREVHRYR